ncbi:MAG: penicillin acylase family protein, partial [Thermoplasmata archaeon]
EAKVRAGLGLSEALGSNNWAVAPAKSATGRALVANDPHLGLSLPSVWYQLRLSSPGFNVYGVSFIGAPPVVLGFNEHVAWGATNTGADVLDFYVEQVNETEGTYLHRGEWKPLAVRQEVIPVRDAEPEALELRITTHGPILTQLDQTVAMRWTGHEPTNELRAFLNMGRARDATEFRAALVDLRVPAQNIVYADSGGNIGMVVNGLYPLRTPGFSGRLPADGASGASDWLGFRPMDEVPEALNPPQGFLVSANQMPTAGNDPYLGWSWADRYRAARITEVLAAKAMITIGDMKALQLDHVSVAAREFVPFLIDAFDALPDGGASLHPQAPSSIAVLRGWGNHDMSRHRPEPTLYWTWLYAYREATFRDEWIAGGLSDIFLPSISVLENLTKNAPTSPWFDDASTAEVEERDDVVRTALIQALDLLEERIGGVQPWGRFHVIQLLHLTELRALSSPMEPRDGGSFTVDVAHGEFADPGLLVRSGPSWRLIVDVGGPMSGYGVYPGGQSGNSVSSHYLDLFAMWMDGEYQTLALTTVAQWEAQGS